MIALLKGIIEGLLSGLLRFFESLRRDKTNQQLGELRAKAAANAAILAEMERQHAIDANNLSVDDAVAGLCKHSDRASRSGDADVSADAATGDSDAD